MQFRALTIAIALPVAIAALMARHPAVVDDAAAALRTGIAYLT